MAHDVEYRTSDEAWDYHRCSSCDVIFLADPHTDRLAMIYPPNYYSYDGGSSRSLLQVVKRILDRRQLRRFLAPFRGESIRLADVGGGVGELASVAREADDRVMESVVVDLDPACAAAAEAAGHRYILGSVDEVELGEVDAVLLFNLIEHVHHPEATLRRLRASLSRGGRMLVKTPNTASWDARHFRHRSWGGYHCPRHWVLFDTRSFRATAERAGLRVERLDLTQGAPFWAVSWFDALERHRVVRRRDGQSMHEHPLFNILLGIAAVLDTMRRPLASTSQMYAVLVPA